MDRRNLDLIATVIERCEGPGEPGPGHPPAETVRVLATLRRFLREGTPWRGLRATSAQASGSTLRRRLADWAGSQPAAAGPRPAGRDAARRPGPDPGQLLGTRQAGRRPHRPEPDRPRQAGDEVPRRDDGDGVPVACAATAANVNDTLLFERLFLTAFAVVAKIGTVFADKGYDAERNRELCRAFGAEPCLHKRGRPRGSGLGKRRWPVERSNAWLLENKRLALRYDRLGFVVQSLLQAACLFLVAGRLVREF